MEGLREAAEKRGVQYVQQLQAGEGGGGAGGESGGGSSGMTAAEIKFLADKVAYIETSLGRVEQYEEAIVSEIGASTSAAGFGRTAKKFQSAVRSATQGVVQAWANLYIFVIVLLLLFILHQVTPPPLNTPETHTRPH